MSTIQIPVNVTFQITSGPNSNVPPQTVTVMMTVDEASALGTGSATFTYTGANGGATYDAIVATMANPEGGTLQSNTAFVGFQQTNGALSVGNQVNVGVIHTGVSQGTHGWTPGIGARGFTYTITASSLMFNTNNNGFPAVGPNLNPGQFFNVAPDGSYAGSGVQLVSGGIRDGAGEAFYLGITGFLVVSQAGNYEIDIIEDDFYGIGFGNSSNGGVATRIDHGGVVGFVNAYNPYFPFLANTLYHGYPISFIANSDSGTLSTFPAGVGPGAPFFLGVMNFSQPGIYPFEIDFGNYEGGTEFQMTYNGGGNRFNGSVLRPVPILGAPTQPGNAPPLQLVPSIAPALLMQGNQITLNLTISGVRFPTQSYMPILEGVPGQVYIYNDPSNNVFTFPSFYGNTPDGPSAATNDFYLVGNNTAWQGQLAVKFDTTPPANNRFEISYNGSQSQLPGQIFQPNVESTTLTVTQEDIAWFNAANKSYDVFQVTTGGGKIFTLPVFYLLNPNFPTGASVIVSGSPAHANGTPQFFTVTLARPLPPLQTNTTMGVSFSGTQPVGGSVSVTPNFFTQNGEQWLGSFTVQATWPSATISSTSTMTMTFQAANITYLLSDTFVTVNNFNYAGTHPSFTVVLNP